MGMERTGNSPPPSAPRTSEHRETRAEDWSSAAMTHTRERGQASGGQAVPQQEGYMTSRPDDRRHRPHPYMPSPHHSPHHQGEIPHIVIDPGENGGERRRPTTIPPMDTRTERKLTVLTLAAKKQRAHSDSVLETHISGYAPQGGQQRHSSSCSDAPMEGPPPSPDDLLGLRIPYQYQPHQEGALNLALDRAATPEKRSNLLDKPQVPFIWRFKKQTTHEETSSATYWLRRHSDSTLPNDPEDLSLSPTRSRSTGDSAPQETAPPGESPANYSQGVMHRRLKLKTYLQTRYQSSLQQEDTSPTDAQSGPGQGQGQSQPSEVAKDLSLSRKPPAPLSFLPEGTTREMMRSVSDSDLETEPETPVFTPLDVFSPAPPTPHSSSKDASDISAGGLRFRFSSFDHLNLSPGDTRGSSESSSIAEGRGSPSQMSVVSTGTERSMEEGGDIRDSHTPVGGTLTLSPGDSHGSGSHPHSPAHSHPHSPALSHSHSPISEGSRSHPISPQNPPTPEPPRHYKHYPHRSGRLGHALISSSSSSPKERAFFTTPAPLSAPPFLSDSPPEVSPYPQADHSRFPWSPQGPQQITSAPEIHHPHTPHREKGKVTHFFPPEFFPNPADMERFSAMQARGMMDVSSPHAHHQGAPPKFFPRATQGKPPTLSPTTLASLEQQQQHITSPFPSPASMDPPSPFPSPISLKVEPGSPKPEGSGGSRKVQPCQFTEQVIEQPLGTGGSGFVCPVCGQLFPSYNYLANHMVNHLPSEVLPKGPGDNNKIHLCKVCNRSFSRSDMLTRHMRLHTGLRPYECRVCGQVFSRSDHLHTHLRTHTGEKPYKCPQCPYAAPRRDMITRHLRIHTKHVVRRGRRSYSASSSREGEEGPRRGQSLSSIDSFESGEQSPGPGAGKDAQQRRSTSLASCDSLESPLPSSSTASHASSFDFDPLEMHGGVEGGAVLSPEGPRGGGGFHRRRAEFPSVSSLSEDAPPEHARESRDTDIQTSFQKVSVGEGETGDKKGQRQSSL